MQEFIKEFRVRLDALAQEVDMVSMAPDVSVAYAHVFESEKSLLLAKAWLGQILSLIPDNKTPYASDGNRTTVDDIEPTADVAEMGEAVVGNIIVEIDSIREKIKFLTEDLWNWLKVRKNAEGDLTDQFKYNIYSTNVINHIMEGRMHLGFALGAMKEAAVPTEVTGGNAQG